MPNLRLTAVMCCGAYMVQAPESGLRKCYLSAIILALDTGIEPVAVGPSCHLLTSAATPARDTPSRQAINPGDVGI
jgi:hypothetical protein